MSVQSPNLVDHFHSIGIRGPALKPWCENTNTNTSVNTCCDETSSVAWENMSLPSNSIVHSASNSTVSSRSSPAMSSVYLEHTSNYSNAEEDFFRDRLSGGTRSNTEGVSWPQQHQGQRVLIEDETHDDQGSPVDGEENDLTGISGSVMTLPSDEGNAGRAACTNSPPPLSASLAYPVQGLGLVSPMTIEDEEVQQLLKRLEAHQASLLFQPIRPDDQTIVTRQSTFSVDPSWSPSSSFSVQSKQPREQRTASVNPTIVLRGGDKSNIRSLAGHIARKSTLLPYRRRPKEPSPTRRKQPPHVEPVEVRPAEEPDGHVLPDDHYDNNEEETGSAGPEDPDGSTIGPSCATAVSDSHGQDGYDEIVPWPNDDPMILCSMPHLPSLRSIPMMAVLETSFESSKQCSTAEGVSSASSFDSLRPSRSAAAATTTRSTSGNGVLDMSYESQQTASTTTTGSSSFQPVGRPMQGGAEDSLRSLREKTKTALNGSMATSSSFTSSVEPPLSNPHRGVDDARSLQSLRERTRVALNGSMESTNSIVPSSVPNQDKSFENEGKSQSELPAIRETWTKEYDETLSPIERIQRRYLTMSDPGLPSSSIYPSRLLKQNSTERLLFSPTHPPSVSSAAARATPQSFSMESRAILLAKSFSSTPPPARPFAAATTSIEETQTLVATATTSVENTKPPKSTPEKISSTLDIPMAPRLSWRMDPSQSLSDWRLEIFNRTTKSFTTYHVHRVVLAVGSRACAYFQRVMMTANNNSNIDPVTRIPLLARACELVPDLLDYLYGDSSFELKTENAVGMAYLANYIQQPQLLKECMEFVHGDLGRDTMDQYFWEATYYDQQELVDWILHIASGELSSLNVQSAKLANFLADISPSQFVNLLERVSPTEQQQSSNLCSILVEFCIHHRHEVSLEFLERCASQIGVLTIDAAIALLEFSWTLGGYYGGDKNSNDTIDAENGSSSQRLQERCLEVLSKGWQTACQRQDAPMFWKRLLEQWMEGPGKEKLLEWLPETLLTANLQLSQAQEELKNVLQQQTVMRDELATAQEQASHFRLESEQLRKSLESSKTELKSHLAGWMRKRESDLLEHKTAQDHWKQERQIWKQERQAWLEERGQMEHELYRMRAELSHIHRVGYKPRGSGRGGYGKPASRIKTKENVCPQLDTPKDLLKYMSEVGMTGMEDSTVSEDSWAEKGASFFLNPI